MGYIVIQVQVDRVHDYDEDQIALVILDLSSFTAWIPVILGTPTISCIMNVIKEREIATVADDKVAIGVSDPVKYYEVVTTKETEMIDAFLSCIIHAKTGSACTGVRLNVMTQALCAEDGSLPQGLTIQNAYTEMCNGSKNVSVL